MENNNIIIFDKTVIYDDNECIFIHPLCELFQINIQNQLRIIHDDPILSIQGTKKSSKFLFGDNFKRVALTKKGFIRWIQIINPNTVNVKLKEKFIQYQCDIFDYIYGEAIIPNIKKQFEIDIQIKKLNKDINLLMLEHKRLENAKKLITSINYNQLGLTFNDDNETKLNNNSVPTQKN